MSESQINLAAVIVIIAIVGVSLVVLTGWAGQVSLGQVAFMGIGAAIGGHLTQRLALGPVDRARRRRGRRAPARR